jgi:hypothetical protein
MHREVQMGRVVRSAGPRDATRGGVNGAALPRHPPEGGLWESPLSIDAMYADGE